MRGLYVLEAGGGGAAIMGFYEKDPYLLSLGAGVVLAVVLGQDLVEYIARKNTTKSQKDKVSGGLETRVLSNEA